ncbi:MAG: hypothetical protein AAF203_08125 [Pseudomonadota bacterium]
MRCLSFFVIFILPLSALAEEEFEAKIYTPQVVVDNHNHGRKGAVQLLWQKSNDETRYEVEVSNGRLVYSQVGEKHFHHVMLHFDKDYQWRVRQVSADHTTEFTSWRPLKVVKGQKWAHNSQNREPVSLDPDVDHFVLDTGE